MTSQQTSNSCRQKSQDSVFKNSLDGIYRSTPEGRFLDVNPALIRMLGYTNKDELLSVDIQRDLYFSESERRSANQRNTMFTTRLRRKDGSEIWVEITSWVVHDEAGNIAYYEGITRDITERKRLEQTIWYQAYHDALTGLPNRYLFNDRLNQALANARRSGHMLGVMFLDLDHFKKVNDTLGHTLGDKLLQMVANRLLKCLREGDTIARFGGDEFILLLQISQSEDAAKVAERILRALQPAFSLEDNKLYVTTSIGISLFPGDGTDAATLLKNADAAMYRSKEFGRDTYQLYSPAINARACERLALESDLRHAIIQQELELHYQPRISLQTMKTTVIEAVVRWQRPQVGCVLPETFLALAEETGLILPTGEWVFRTALQQVYQWKGLGLTGFKVSLHLSARQFRQENLLTQIQRALAETKVPADMLELAITENTALQNVDASAVVMRKMNDLGIAITLDRFGGGYSSVYHLKKLPIHALKIDRMLIRTLDTDPDSSLVVGALIALAHSLKLKVCAEGVTSKEHLNYLRLHSCDEIQGPLVSLPVPPSFPFPNSLDASVYPIA